MAWLEDSKLDNWMVTRKLVLHVVLDVDICYFFMYVGTMI